MFKAGLQDTKLLLLLLPVLFIKLFSLQPALVETYYSTGIYPVLAKSLRALLCWIPFSLGDLLYAAAGIYILYGLIKLFKNAIRRQLTRSFIGNGLYKLVKMALLVYLWFNAFWGLNYNRLGIAHQLELTTEMYTLPDVVALTTALKQRLNYYAAMVDTISRFQLNEHKMLVGKGVAGYAMAEKKFPFLSYSFPAIKPSLYTHIGQYVGFTGYYNPFTAEAQLKTTIPAFLKPFILTHEIAHQVGYARENEANFIAYLASAQATDVHVLYAAHFEMYRYALREVYNRDTMAAATFKEALHPQVKADMARLRAYLLRTQNKIEPLMSLFYDRYLKLNEQKGGVQTYNEVVALLVGYYKKYGLPPLPG